MTALLLVFLSFPGPIATIWLGWTLASGRDAENPKALLVTIVLVELVTGGILFDHWGFLVIVVLANVGLGIWAFFIGRALWSTRPKVTPKPELTEPETEPEPERHQEGLILFG